MGWGSVFLSPFVRQLAVEAQGSAAGNFLAFYSPNGFYRGAFGADGSTTSFTLRSSTAALAPHQSDLAIFRNISNMCYPGTERSHNCITRVMTCKAGTENLVATGPSFDHVVAKHFGGTPLILGAQPQRSDFTWHRQLSWAAAGNAVRPQLDTKALFTQLFPAEPGTPPTQDDSAAKENKRNKSVLDGVRADIATLQGRLDARGREKLELHMTSLRELEQSIERSEVTEMMAATCDSSALQTKVNGSLPNPASGTPRTSKAYTPLLKAHGELQLDLAVQALLCGKKRVATMIWQECSWEGVNVEGVDSNESHHKITHYASDPIHGDGPTQMKACDAFYAARLKYLLDKLKAVGILDDTIVLWLTEVRESHDQGEYTWITAGGRNLGVKLGRYHDFPYYGPHNNPRTDTRNRTTSDLFVSIQKALGIQSNTFGDAEWCHGGLSEYFG